MECDLNQAKLLLTAVEKFPDLPHNLLSTATDEDRRVTIAAILRWWNGEVVPILMEIERGHD